MSKLIKNTFIYTIGSIIPQAAGFILLPIYTKYLTPADYGIVASMAVLSSVLAIVFTLCVERSLYRLYYDYKDEQGRRDFLGTLYLFSALFSLAILLLIFLFRHAIGTIFKSISFYPYYTYLILASFFNMFGQIPLIYFQVKEKANYFVMLSVGQFLLNTAFILWFVVGLKAGAAGQLKAGMISSMIMFPVYLAIISRMINLTIKPGILKHTLAFSLPLIPSMVTAWVLNLSNRVFIERFFNLSEVGIYSLGFKIGTIGLVIISGFNSAYAPHYYKLANEQENGEANKQRLKKSNEMFAIFLIAVSFVIALFARELVVFFMNARYVDSYYVSRIVAYSYCFSGFSGIASLAIMQAKKTKQDMYISIGGAGLNILLNFALIPTFGMYGAAVATLLTFLAIGAAEYIYSRNCGFFIPLNLRKIFGYLTLSIMIIIIYQTALEKYLWPALASKIVLAGGISYLLIRKIMPNLTWRSFDLSGLFQLGSKDS